MKKLLIFITALAVTFSMNSCSMMDMVYNSENYESSQSEESKSKIDIIIEALETKDSNLMKSVFSEHALTLDTDIDRGIDYMFGLYEGEFEEIVYSNGSSQKHFEKNASTTLVRPVYVIKTSEKYYRISWDVWTVQEADPSAVGIYSLYLMECQADTKGAGGGSIIAGVTFPERMPADNNAASICKSLVLGDSDNFKKILSDTLLSQPDAEQLAEDFVEQNSSINASSVGDGWIRYEGDILHTYMIVNINPVICIYFRSDSEQPDKISVLKVTEIEDGKSVDDYILEADETGIYLP